MASQVETICQTETESLNKETTSSCDTGKTSISSSPAENGDNKDDVAAPEHKNIMKKLCYGDGNDSGVECVAGVQLQRALSSNSGGYASSGGLDETAGNGSCASSMISCCSDTCEPKPSVNINDCTSEVGSESSSVTGVPCERKQSVIKKKVALTEPNIIKSAKRDDNSVARSRSRAASANRAAVAGSQILVSDRARSRDKMTSSTMSLTKSVHPQNRSTPIKRSHIPDSLPSGLKEISSPTVQRIVGTRTPSASRNRTPGTPTVEDGRWPSMGTKSTGTTKSSRGGSATPENVIVKTRVGLLNLDLKSPTVDKFATLPRRRREKSTDDLFSNARSSSAQREKMTSSIRRQQSLRDSPSTRTLSLPRRSKTIPRTKIYHEITVQTAITGKDIEDAFGGIKKDINIESIETRNKSSQVDIRDKEIELLQEQVRKLTDDYVNLQGQLTERSETLNNVEQQLNKERDEKQAMTKELQSNTERVLGLLSLVKVQVPTETSGDSLLMLESQIQLSGYELEMKQQEVDKLNRFCEELQGEMHRSIRVQKTLIEEKECAEKESSELQDFLQDEKAALVDALKEAENECERMRQSYTHKDVDIERLQEECRHLVRISEQRRSVNFFF